MNRTVLFANNRLGDVAARYLESRGELAALVVHPTQKRRIIDADTWSDRVSVLAWPVTFEQIAAFEPETILSVMFGYVLDESMLSVANWDAVNIHPSLLPFNRGADPNVWPLVDGSPAGVSIHRMVRDVDAGPVYAQSEVTYHSDDTARDLYQRLEGAAESLLRLIWPDIRSIEPVPQATGGSFHRRSELSTLDLHERDHDLIDRLRARTFDAHGSVVTRPDGRYRVRVTIEREEP